MKNVDTHRDRVHCVYCVEHILYVRLHMQTYCVRIQKRQKPMKSYTSNSKRKIYVLYKTNTGSNPTARVLNMCTMNY